MNWNSIKLALPLLFAVACAKEIPGPPGDFAEEGATLTVSLPVAGTKTALGDKADGRYPVLWKEGDCLSLNGFSSLPLPAGDAGSTSAGFVFRDGLTAPYNLLYPVSGEADLVVFPATQMHVAGGFDPAAVPMWGTSASYTSVSLRHFFSLVRISIKTETARVLKSITLTAIGGEPLCGSFRAGTDGNGAFDGSLKVEDGKPSVLYSFGNEGLSLAAGQTVVAYISIPSGSYSAGFKAVVQSAAHEYRQLRFFSGGRSVAAGKVLEFPDKEFDECSVVWEYYVSATGIGDGTSEETPMSIPDLMSLLDEPEGTRLKDATIHFVAGSHAVTEPIILPGKNTYDIPLTYTITGDGQAVLDGGGNSRIFLVSNDNSHITIKDMELTRGSSETGGLVLIQENGPLFEGCRFTNTTSGAAGGAVRIDTAGKGVGTFVNCAFSDNVGSHGGAFVITNARTSATFTGCTFSGNMATTSGGAVYSTNGNAVFSDCDFTNNTAASFGGAFYITTGTVTVDDGSTISGNSAANGGAVCVDGAGTVNLDRVSVTSNYASGVSGGLYTGNSKSAVYYINGCSFVDNTCKGQNGACVYLNTSTVSFATLCVNNSTFYNSAPIVNGNGSLVCNKGKSLILNSTIHANTATWGTWALGCHKNFGDEYGCLLLNSIFVNTAPDKPAIYQTGTNYFAIAKNCIVSAASENAQFTQKGVVNSVPLLSWDGSLFTWDGTTKLSQWTRLDIETELAGDTYAPAADFLAWLKSLKYNIDGSEYDALDVDQQGHLRSTYSWAGAYQK